jgi:glycosyltransferase involved in cell wall biosynthesis
MSPLLTIAIPFYRGQAYLRQAIDSVLQQTHNDWHLLICDDCGPEPGTAELVGSYREARIRYERNEQNLGMSGNWNRCLDLAPADLVTLLHADDRLLPNYVDVMTTSAAQHPAAALFFCRSQIIDRHGRRCFSLPDYIKRFLEPTRGVMRLEGETALVALLRGNFIMCPTVCYRKRVLGARRFSTEWKQVQDLDLYSRLLLEGEHLIGLPDVAYAYRRHAENATARQTEDLMRFHEEIALYDRLATTAQARGWDRARPVAGAKRMIKLHLLYRAARDVFSLRPGAAWRKTTLLRSLS